MGTYFYKNSGTYGSEGFEACKVCCTHGWMESSPCMRPCIYCEVGKQEQARLDRQELERRLAFVDSKVKKLKELSKEYERIEKDLIELRDDGYLDADFKLIEENLP